MALAHVQPGDLITAATFNRLIDAINAIGDRPDPIDPAVKPSPYEVALEERRRRKYSQAIVATGKTDIEQMRPIVEMMVADGATPVDLILVLGDAGVASTRIVELLQEVAELG